ncbi:MAG: hypothetical protein M3463_14360 [Verrucomicrobiota bacterium]|nr:hypothetical protein [Verrucomicrobiota bacterium]
MRYLVRARVRPGREEPLRRAIDEETLGKGSVAGDEYLHNMRQARVDKEGGVQWVEVCFCRTPLAEERAYWEEYFELVSVKDAHDRKNCRDVNGAEPWACCDCDCTRRLEQRLATCGSSFLETLRKSSARAIGDVS